jgi:hypothetical protein
MYVFATAALLGLGVMALVAAVDHLIKQTVDYRPVLMVVLGVLGAWLADYDMFARWGIAMRAHWVGIVLTGLVLGGMAHAWHEVLGFFTGLVRKTNDEAAALEKTQELKAA